MRDIVVLTVRFPASEITSALMVTRLRTGIIPEQFLGSLMRPRSAVGECFFVMRVKRIGDGETGKTSNSRNGRGR